MIASVAPKPDVEPRSCDLMTMARQTLMVLPKQIEDKLKALYYFDNIDMSRGSFRWSSSAKRVYCPIYNADKVVIGGTYRTLEKGVLPKSIIQQDRTEWPKMSCYKNLGEPWKKVLIVEDQFSAIAGHVDNISTVALLGTNFSMDKARAISDRNPEQVVLCLDPDAYSVAIDFHYKYGGLFNKSKFTVVRPDKDLKDMTREARREFVRRAFA